MAVSRTTPHDGTGRSGIGPKASGDMTEHNNTNDDAQCCYGFRICSSEVFKFLRHGGGRDVMTVRRVEDDIRADEDSLLHEWTLRDRRSVVTARLYGDEDVFRFWASDAGWYWIDPVARIVEMSDHSDDIRQEQRLWGIPTALCAKYRGDVVLHAAAAQAGNGAILLAAPGRFGKTTLAMALHQAGFRLLTEDTACCGLKSGPELYPGPTSVRLRPDMFDGNAPSGTTITAVRDDRIHLTLSRERAGDGRPLPIKGIFFLRESRDDVWLEPVKASQALPDLWTLVFRFRSTQERRQSFGELSHLASIVPIWNLHRPLRSEVLNEVVDRLVGTVT
jgi:hypothetical protein